MEYDFKKLDKLVPSCVSKKKLINKAGFNYFSELVIRYLESGYTQRSISEYLGYDPTTLRKFLKDAGLSFKHVKAIYNGRISDTIKDFHKKERETTDFTPYSVKDEIGLISKIAKNKPHILPKYKEGLMKRSNWGGMSRYNRRQIMHHIDHLIKTTPCLDISC